MRALLQRVDSCKIEINNKNFSEIGKGLLIFLGIKKEDSKEDVEYLVNKIIVLRKSNFLKFLSVNVQLSMICNKILKISG